MTRALLVKSQFRLQAPPNGLVLGMCAKAETWCPDYVHVVSNRRRHKNCSRSHGIPVLRRSSTPSWTVQQFPLDHDVLCSVPLRHSSRMLRTTASVPESARAAGRRRIHVSSYIAYSGLCVGPNDRRSMPLIGRSFPARCCRMHARFLTRRLALSLLQHNPVEWRRQHGAPSSSGSANTVTSSPNENKNTRLKATHRQSRWLPPKRRNS
jgi:hypothetical protein